MEVTIKRYQMNPEREKEIVKKYPSLFREHGGDPRKTCMAWGLAVGDGWADIIEDIAAKIAEIDTDNRAVALQVKEKFGGLRFYWTVSDATDDDKALIKEIRQIVNAGAVLASQTCEVCGRPGRLNYSGWRKTLCSFCNYYEVEMAINHALELLEEHRTHWNDVKNYAPLAKKAREQKASLSILENLKLDVKRGLDNK
jgi:uncharacterized Zn finger protein (UPF0148 family)